MSHPSQSNPVGRMCYLFWSSKLYAVQRRSCSTLNPKFFIRTARHPPWASRIISYWNRDRHRCLSVQGLGIWHYTLVYVRTSPYHRNRQVCTLHCTWFIIYSSIFETFEKPQNQLSLHKSTDTSRTWFIGRWLIGKHYPLSLIRDYRDVYVIDVNICGQQNAISDIML